MYADEEVITTEVPISDVLVETLSEGLMIGDGTHWEIHHNEEVSPWSNIHPCKHCSPVALREINGSYRDRFWTVPKMVIAYNEGGYASTGICLDCILEAVK